MSCTWTIEFDTPAQRFLFKEHIRRGIMVTSVIQKLRDQEATDARRKQETENKREVN